jgi:hypothetical protein
MLRRAVSAFERDRTDSGRSFGCDRSDFYTAKVRGTPLTKT